MSSGIALTIPDLRVGAMWRRTTRRQIRKACARGADVNASERWGLLGSSFTISATGTAHQIAPLIAFTALADRDLTRRALTQLTDKE